MSNVLKKKTFIQIDSSEQQGYLSKQRKTLKVCQDTDTDKENKRSATQAIHLHKIISDATVATSECPKRLKVDTSTVETQTTPVKLSGNVFDNSEITVSDLTGDNTLSTQYWRCLAEERQRALKETLVENSKLSNLVNGLENELELARKQLEITQHAVDVLKEICAEDDLSVFDINPDSDKHLLTAGSDGSVTNEGADDYEKAENDEGTVDDNEETDEEEETLDDNEGYGEEVERDEQSNYQDDVDKFGQGTHIEKLGEEGFNSHKVDNIKISSEELDEAAIVANNSCEMKESSSEKKEKKEIVSMTEIKKISLISGKNWDQTKEHLKKTKDEGAVGTYNDDEKPSASTVLNSVNTKPNDECDGFQSN